MIKKLDKFLLSRFLGPFILAYAVVTFIFLIQHLIRYFRHFVGKDLGLWVFAELFSNFALMLTPVTLPLAVLLSSLMSFGSLGEHSELTAIKGSGVSLLRMFRPIGAVVLFLTMGAVYFNDVISPEANLAAFSLLYDIKQKKPSLELKEGAFYDGLPGYSIRIENKSGEEGKELEGLMIYNHSARQGNTDLIMAERGRMYSTHNGDYLVLEMLDGKRYTDISTERGVPQEREFLQNDFDSSKIVFSMESFGMKETKKELFKSHNMMKTASQLLEERDSIRMLISEAKQALPQKAKAYYYYQFPPEDTEVSTYLQDSKSKKLLEKQIREQREKKPANKTTEEYAKKEKGNNSRPPAHLISQHAKQDSLDSIRQAKLAENPFVSTRKRVWDKIELSPIINKAGPLDSLISRRGTPPDPSLLPSKELLAKVAEVEEQNASDDSLTLEERLQAKNRARKIKASELRVSKAFEKTEDTKGGIRKRERPRSESLERTRPNKTEVEEEAEEDTPWHEERTYRMVNMAWSKANGAKIAIQDVKRRIERQTKNRVSSEVELHNKYARALAVFIMFLIGAPLGAIIKKGGLGVPILISILFFIIYYITTITGTKLAKSEIVPVVVGSWGGDFLLLLCGLFFLRQAYKDSRLLDLDYYYVIVERAKSWWKGIRGKQS